MRLQLAAGKGAAALGAVMMLGAALTLGGCKQKGEYLGFRCQESPGGEYPAVQPV